MTITYTSLSAIPVADMLALLNHPGIARHMPLSGHMDEPACRAWAAAKDQQWQDNGYGPWAILVDGVFVGWGGYQKEDEDVDLALVLLPESWGVGPRIARDMLRRGWDEFGFASVICLLPPTRTRLKPLFRLGFRPDGSLDYGGQTFLRFRITRPAN